MPKVIETPYCLQVVAQGTPYVAAAGANLLYFIDTRFDNETAASHVKEQIERESLPKVNEYISIDEVSATAEIKNSATGETTFVFDPLYARVIFAKGDLKLPEREPAGDWLVDWLTPYHPVHRQIRHQLPRALQHTVNMQLRN